MTDEKRDKDLSGSSDDHLDTRDGLRHDQAQAILVDDSEDDERSSLKRVIRKIDARLIPPLAILYLFSYMDRSALANASIFGFRTDLQLSSVQYNIVSTVFFIPYGLLEVPANIIVSMVRPSIWITCLCFAWGTVMTLTCLVQNYTGAVLVRFFLGVTEAGFFPAAVSLVGDWYPKRQLQSRISAFYVVCVFSGAFGGAIAYGIDNLNGKAGLASWRWIFLIEGLATVALSPLIFFFLPDSPERCKFLKADEKEIITASRAAAGNATSAHFEWKYLREVVTDYKIYMTTFLSSAINIAVFGFIFSLPTVLTQLGYTAAHAQLMTIPVYAVACSITFLTGLLSDRINKRSPAIIIGLSISLIGLILLYTLPKDRAPQARYFGCVLFMSGQYAAFPGTISWMSNNAESRGKRNIAVGFQLTIASLATMAGTNSYLGWEAPYYQTGFGLGMAVTATGIVVATSLMLLLKRENRKLDEQRANGGLLNKDLDPDFRYVL